MDETLLEDLALRRELHELRRVFDASRVLEGRNPIGLPPRIDDSRTWVLPSAVRIRMRLHGMGRGLQLLVVLAAAIVTTSALLLTSPSPTVLAEYARTIEPYLAPSIAGSVPEVVVHAFSHGGIGSLALTIVAVGMTVLVWRGWYHRALVALGFAAALFLVRAM
jgi:hypothetical protein